MKECITHSFACECREAKFAELEAKTERLAKEIETLREGLNKIEDNDHCLDFGPYSELAEETLQKADEISRKTND